MTGTSEAPTRRHGAPGLGVFFACALAAVALVASLFVGVHLEPSRVLVQWPENTPSETRDVVELARGLVDRRSVDAGASGGATVSYLLVDARRAGIAALLEDSRLTVRDGIDRERGELVARSWSLRWLDAGERVAVQPQSIISLAAAIALLALSYGVSRRVRVIGAVAIVTALTVGALATPVRQDIHMGDFRTYTSSRGNFTTYIAAPYVRFEAHLSSMLLRAIDAGLGRTDQSPALAFADLGMYASIWFGLMLLLAGWTLGWAPSALRYLALTSAAPVTVMFFGYRELGYLALNPAVFPLLVTGLRGCRGRFAAGCSLAGLGAALHGFGLLSLAGAAGAAAAARLRLRERGAFVIRTIAFGTSAYLIWIFLYVAVLGLSVVPGHSSQIPWRPLTVNALSEFRISPALLSVAGLREVFVVLWVVGAALLATVVARWRSQRPAALLVAAFTLPSLVFVIGFWPIQGLAREADLLFGAFPALYALAWLASRSSRVTWWALLALASGHAVLWRVLLGGFFINGRVT